MQELIRPEIQTLFDTLNLTPQDRELIATFRRPDSYMYIHGSCVRGTFGPSSDVDFSVIHTDFSRYLKDYFPHFPEVDDVDSMGQEIPSPSGHDLSFHILRDTSRMEYGNRGYSNKLRFSPARNVTMPTPAFDIQGVPLVVNFTLPSTQIQESLFLLHIPQSGLLEVNNSSAQVTDTPISFPIGDIQRLNEYGELAPYTNAQQIFVWGTEANKALTDTPLSLLDESFYSQYVTKTLEGSLKALLEYVPQENLQSAVHEMLLAQALYRNKQANRVKVDPSHVSVQIHKKIRPIISKIQY